MPRIQGTQIPSNRSQDAAECAPACRNHPHDFTKSHKYVTSLKTGLRGWNEYDLPLVDLQGNTIDAELGDKYFANKLLAYQRKPKDWVE